jgi:hypothetical protein
MLQWNIPELCSTVSPTFKSVQKTRVNVLIHCDLGDFFATKGNQVLDTVAAIKVETGRATSRLPDKSLGFLGFRIQNGN